LLSDVGRPADAATALEALAEANPKWPGRADAMVRAAVLLDSLGRPAEAAAAFEKFSEAYPADRRAADAQYNAAVIRRDARDAAGAARTFLAFATRFPRDPRVGEANAARLVALRAAGDTANIGAELARLCVRPPEAMAATCADRAGAAAFAAGMARWDAYAALRLEIKSRAQLTRAGVDAASAPKLQAFRAITRSFTQAIASGAPPWVAAGRFQTGLAQWYYGLFLRDVVLPADLTDAQRTGAQQGSAQQAQQYFDLAVKTWTALVDKAAADKFDNDWVARARAALRGEGVPAREKAP
ncbi:MAG: tetratricopeptide repeat protein, partial [Gemmatimonadota bacterium]|nr:tetratricopeptide repeat protein [Gemmatimonadota bacterium]